MSGVFQIIKFPETRHIFCIPATCDTGLSSKTRRPITQRHVTEDLNPQRHRCLNRKSRTLLCLWPVKFEGLSKNIPISRSFNATLFKVHKFIRRSVFISFACGKSVTWSRHKDTGTGRPTRIALSSCPTDNRRCVVYGYPNWNARNITRF